MNAELAYLLGASGDATFYFRKKKNEYSIEYEQKSSEWLEKSIIPRIFSVYSKKPKLTKKKSGLFRVRFYSKDAYYLFKDFRSNPEKIISFDETCRVFFVRGFFDAEGSAPIDRHRIVFYQKDLRVLKLISKILKSKGFKPGKISNSRDIGLLPLYGRENVIKFIEIVKPEHPVKSISLRDRYFY